MHGLFASQKSNDAINKYTHKKYSKVKHHHRGHSKKTSLAKSRFFIVSDIKYFCCEPSPYVTFYYFFCQPFLLSFLGDARYEWPHTFVIS